MKSNKTMLLRIASIATSVVVGVGLGIGNAYALKNENNLNQILCPPVVNEQELQKTQEKGHEMSKQIVSEGAVLLKNNNNVLPLDKGNTSLNIFGWASVDWAYGANSGSCSGRVMSEDGSAASLIDLYDALETYGVEYNTELKNMYTRYFTPYVYALKDPGSINNNNVITLHEPNIEDRNYYSTELLQNAADYSDTAIVVITRNAGEDIPADRAMRKGGSGAVDESDKIYLDLSVEEEGMLTYVGANFENVVVVINCSVAMDLEFLNTIPGLDAALQVGFTGTHGAEIIPELLYGDISPSGRLVDTYAYDRNTSFAMLTKNGARWSSGGNGKQVFEYIENIYVGYRWYETADAEDYWYGYSKEILDENDNLVEKEGFDAVVQYPFGYGLSYAEFEWQLEGYEIRDNGQLVSDITPTSEITFNVNVTNVGDYAGKDVVQIYLTAPYYDGEIEKSFVSLVGYEKTITLQPGENQIVNVTVDAYDCLSYDCYDMNGNNHTGYELDRGTYQFKLMTNSHTVKKINIANGASNVDGIMEFDVGETVNVDTDKYTGATVQNLFTGEDAIDGYPIDGIDGDYSPDYLTRADFTSLDGFEGPKSRAASDKLNSVYRFTQEKGDEWDNAVVDAFGNDTYQGEVVWGADNGYKVYENEQVTDIGYQLGADYDDPLWTEVLDQITIQECLSVINMSYGTPEIPSIGKPVCPELDGPAQIKCYYQSAPRGTGYPSAVLLAQTWNKVLAEDFGLSYAQDMTSVGINGLWGWGVNIHRTPVGGRNWEYYSEDPFISGTILLNAVKGLNKGGRYCYIKHFALNETESNKVEGFTFTTEQALREIYFKPFQMAIEQGGALGVMTCFNRIGAVYGGGSEAAIAGVIRGEWGFRGAIITDWANNGGYMSIDDQLRAGGDLGMNTSLNGAGTNFQYNANGPARLQYQMKEAMHHVLYAWLRSQYLNKEYNENPETNTQVIQTASVQSWQWWKVLLIDADVIIGGLCLIWVVTAFMPEENKVGKREE
ncbi:MAG: hypothetical protein E7370_03465 [Clostridiales bacterium]|nr:hypothetical protein [Clostridiales bacterium]